MHTCTFQRDPFKLPDMETVTYNVYRSNHTHSVSGVIYSTAQSERNFHSKSRDGKENLINNQVHILRNCIISRMSSNFPSSWPLSYPNLTKNMKAYIRYKQHKNLTSRHKTIKTTIEVSSLNDQKYKIPGGL